MAVRSRSGFRFETLEPRLLLSADLAPLHTQPDGMDVTLALDMGSQAILLLDCKHGGVEIERLIGPNKGSDWTIDADGNLHRDA